MSILGEGAPSIAHIAAQREKPSAEPPGSYRKAAKWGPPGAAAPMWPMPYPVTGRPMTQARLISQFPQLFEAQPRGRPEASKQSSQRML